MIKLKLLNIDIISMSILQYTIVVFMFTLIMHKVPRKSQYYWHSLIKQKLIDRFHCFKVRIPFKLGY